MPALALVLAAALSGPGAPAAEFPERITSVSNNFAPADITIEQGADLAYTNADPRQPHNVTAVSAGRSGAPLFRTDTIDLGDTAMVEGLAALAPGVYDFVCTLHPGMTGSLTIEDP